MGHWEGPIPFSTSEFSSGEMPNSTAGLSSASSADACISIVHSLMCHRMGGESESFAKRAIECLVKKLKEKPDELDNLILAVTLVGSQPTKCCTIPRTLDGRLQVAGKKVFPHVIYARIWRWSDIQKSELRQIDQCQFAFDLKLDNVCVNPYHYDRVISHGLDLSLHGINLQHGEEEGFEFEDPSRVAYGMGGVFQGDLPPMLAPPRPSATEDRKPSCNVNHGGTMTPHNGMGFEPYPLSPQGDFVTGYHHGGSGSGGGGGQGMPSPSPSYWPPGHPRQLGELNDPMAPFLEEQQRIYEQNRYEDALRKQHPPDYWCTISYFELDQQVGETFKVRSAYKAITVDGFANPSHSDRFCLGPLTNHHRTEVSEKARLFIGKGICLEYHEDFSVWLNVFGTGEADSYSVFGQSYYLDHVQNRAPGDAVHKIRTNAYLKVFDLKFCYDEMMRQLEAAQALQCAQVAAVTGRSQNSLSPVPPLTMGASAGIGADDLRRLCLLRLSFVKGWGPDYNRKTIKETPCWIEVQINRALQLLDEVLRSAPSNEPRSMTEYS